MRAPKGEQPTNSKHAGDGNVSENSFRSKNIPSKTDVDPRFDFSSEFFDPEEVLGSGDITLPFPDVRPYNNLSEYNSFVFNKVKRPRNCSNKSADNFYSSSADQNGRQPSGSQKSDYSQELFVEKKEGLPSRSKANSANHLGSSEGTNESEIENFRISSSKDTCTMSLSGETVDLQVSQDDKMNKNSNLNAEKKMIKNMTVCKGKPSPPTSDIAKHRGLIEETRKVETDNKTCSDNSSAKNPSNNNEHSGRGHYGRRNTANNQEKSNYYGSGDELCLEVDSSEQQEIDNILAEKESKKCKSSFVSKSPFTQSAYKPHYDAKRKQENCDKEDKTDTDYTSRNISDAREQDTIELQMRRQNSQEVMEKEHTTQFHKTVRNKEMANENASASEKLKNYKIPKLKNKADDTRNSETAAVGAENKSNKNGEIVNKKIQSKALNVIESRNIEESDLSVSQSRKQSFVKNQANHYTKDNKISPVVAEKGQNFKSNRAQRETHQRATIKNSKQNIEHCYNHHKEKSGMNTSAAMHGMSSNNAHGEKDRKCIDAQTRPAEDHMKHHENRSCSSRCCQDHHHYPSGCGGEHHHSLEVDEHVHCHSESEESPYDHCNSNKTRHRRSGSGGRRVHPRSNENCCNHSSHSCSHYDENCHNRSRGHENRDNSRSNESFHDHSRHDRRHYDHLKNDRYDRDRFRHEERYHRYRSERGRSNRSFRDRLEYDRYHQDRPRCDGNRRGQFKRSKSRRGNQMYPDFHHGTHDRRRSWERHESDDDEKFARCREKEQTFNDYKRCESKHDKSLTNAEDGKIQKPENKVDERKNENNLNASKNLFKRRKRVDYEDGELFSDSDSDSVMETETMNFLRKERNQEKLDRSTHNVEENIFTQARKNQNHCRKLREYGNEGANEAQVHGGHELGEVSSEVSAHHDDHGQVQTEHRFISEKMDEPSRILYGSHNKEKDISKECQKDYIQEEQHGHDVSNTCTASSERSVINPLNRGSRKRQANLLDYKGFTVKSGNKTSVLKESCNTISGTSETSLVAGKAADNSDSDTPDLTDHFDKLERSSNGQMSSTPNALPPHSVLNWSENWDSSYPENGQKPVHENEFRKASCQNGNVEERGNKNSGLEIQCSVRNNDSNVGRNQEEFQSSDSDSSRNFSDEDDEERNLEENSGIPHKSEKQCWKVTPPLKNSESKNQRETAEISCYDLFGTSSDEDDDDADKQDRIPKESKNNLNAEFQNANSRNSSNSTLFGSISDENDFIDEPRESQFEKKNVGERCSSPSENVQNPCESISAENLGNEENDEDRLCNVNPNSDDGFSDEDIGNGIGKCETAEYKKRNLEKCNENLNGELQSSYNENNARSTESKECLPNCELEIKKNVQNEFCDLESAPDEELRNCVHKSMCQNKTPENSLDSETPTLSPFKVMEKAKRYESIKNSEEKQKQYQSHVNKIHGDSYTSESVDCEQGLIVKDLLTSDAKGKEDRKAIYENIKLLKQNATEDCVCKCHKNCGTVATNSKRMVIIRTYCDKSTQVNFDANEDYEEHVNLNIVHIKVILSGDHAFIEDYKKSVLHENMNQFLMKCNEDARKSTSFMGDKENTEEEYITRPEVCLKVSKGKRKCTEIDGVQEVQYKKRRT